MATVRRAVWWLLATVGALVGLIALYVATAFALPWVATRPAEASAVATIEAYVVSNGAHTDLVFPLRSAQIDWTTVFAPAHFAAMPADAEFIAIGWGDREFYLHTPRWRDLTASRAVGALSGTGRSLLHVDWLRRDQLGSRVWRLPLTAAQYDSLIAHVRDTLPPTGPAVAVPGASYHRTDAFFEARGAYDVFTTCNTWTGQALRRAGLRTSPWTPFAPNVVAHLDAVPLPP